LADKKLTALTELTAPVSTDIFYIVDDPGGTPLDRKVTGANLGKALTAIPNATDITASGTITDGAFSTTAGAVTGVTTLTVDNLTVNGNTITADTGALNLTPAAGSAIVLDGAINVDAGVVTGATSITSTTFVGALTGQASTVATITGLAPDTATTQAAQAAITSLGTLTTLTVDDITINGNTISSAGASTLAITPTAGQSITFDGTVTLDAGVILGATSITSTAFVGALTGQADTVATITGLAPDTATTQATQASITTCANLTTVGTVTSGNVDAVVSAANLTTAGKIEVATVAETDTGTDAGRAVSPDGLAGSIHGEKMAQVVAFDFTTDTATGNGAAYFRIPSGMNGMNLVEVAAAVITAGTTNTTDIQIHNLTQAADMLSTVITIDSTETDSSTAATPAVIDAANDDVATADMIRIDVDAVSTTAAKGLLVTCVFQTP